MFTLWGMIVFSVHADEETASKFVDQKTEISDLSVKSHVIQKNEPYYYNSPSSDIARIGGLNLSSDDLIPLSNGSPILKTFNVSRAPKINDDTLIIQVLRNQNNIENLLFCDVSISDKCMQTIAGLNNLKRLQLIHTDYITWQGLY
jgi:hypothetical protein